MSSEFGSIGAPSNVGPGGIDWSRVQRWGAYAGLTLVFIAATGMTETFEKRVIIDPWLTMGALAMAWVPVVYGHIASRVHIPDGVEPAPKGERELAAGGVAGLISGLYFSLFIVIIANFDLTTVFSRTGAPLVEQLTFGKSLGVACLLWILGLGLLGLFGGALHLFSQTVRRVLAWAALGVLGIALMEVIVTDLLEGLSLEFVADWIYALNGGLTVVSSIVLAVVFGVIGYFRGDKTLQQRRIERMNLDPDELRRKNSWAIAITIIAVILVPMFVGGLTNELLSNVGLFVLMGLGLNIVVGYAGLLDLGYVAFFAVGAYTTAILTSSGSPYWSPELTLNFLTPEGWIVLGTVILVAAIAGILVGTPVIRLRGDYLAIVTLGFGEIVRILFLSDWLAPYFGGPQGIRPVPSAEIGPIVIEGTNSQSIFYLVAIFCALAIYVSWRLQKSRTGRAWSALREDEDVAEAMGINTTASKLTAFVAGAILASFAGMIFAVKVGSVFPNSFRLLVSIVILVIVIVGGMGSIPGVIVGAVVLIGVLGGPTQPGLLQEFSEYKLLLYGVILVVMMLKRPEGLWPSLRRQRELHENEMSQDAWLNTPHTHVVEDGE
ncbi:MAG: branched-chain amino acid ABC transporter permease [Acidimicrobiia bacterium]